MEHVIILKHIFLFLVVCFLFCVIKAEETENVETTETKPPVKEFTKRDCENGFPGPCKAKIPRWRWDIEKNECILDNYGGCDPTPNNFESKRQCENVALPVCGVYTKQDCSKGTESEEYPQCKALTYVWKWDEKANDCVNATYGGCNPTLNNFPTQKECLKVAAPICKEEKKFTAKDCENGFPGPCKARIPRWRWDIEQNKCIEDIYGGCKPTPNNFETKQQCENVALPVCAVFKQEDCLKDTQSKDYPPCEALIIVWKWDDVINNCIQSTYGGCNPTPNNFKTQQECQKVAAPVCAKKCKPKFKVKDCENGFPGPCRAAIPRWRWDIEQNECILDSYGGCQPTPNNFQTKQQCENVALPVCAVFEEEDCSKDVESNEYPHCLALMTRWKWDEKQEKCIKVTYGGCNPTPNNFKTEKKCIKVATPICSEDCKT